MPRKYQSGAAKRKLLENRKAEDELFKGSLQKFICKEPRAGLPHAEKNPIEHHDPDTHICNPTTYTCENEYLPSPVAGSNERCESCDGTAEGYNPDPACWSNVTDDLREHFISNPPNQNVHLVSETERVILGKKRCLTKDHFVRIKQNKESTSRQWLVLSPSTFALFCWVCKLFSGSSEKKNSALSTSGYNDWKHVSVRLAEHENSIPHREAVVNMSLRLQSLQRIDSSIVSQHETESRYWRDVLKRVVSTVLFLAKRGLPFFGSNETIGSVNNGNFLGCLELISEFDPFLATHLQKYGNPGSGKTNYLSSTTIDEFIELMSQKVKEKIIEEIKVAKYFSLIVDSTPDITHVDQLCFVIRYVAIDDEPVERFLTFVPIHGHDAKGLEGTVLACLLELGLDIMNCRGQSYDNASNMAGRYSGLQARIKEINPLAEFVPCAAHSLNLVGVNAVETCTIVMNFFCILQQIYNFFSASTQRWQGLSNAVKSSGASHITLKSRATTRWCSDANATKALRKHYRCIEETLHNLAESSNETAVTKTEARGLLKKLEKLETALNAVIWDTILQRLNKVSKIFQNPLENLSEVPALFTSLIDFVQFVRNNFDEYEKEAKGMSDTNDYSLSRKHTVPRSRDLDDTNTPEADLTPRMKFITTCHYVLCDDLIAQLSRRRIPYDNFAQKFFCLFNLKSETLVTEEAKRLQKCYPNDLSEEFCDELQQFSCLVDKGDQVSHMLKKLKKLNLTSVFPNVETAFRMFLTIPISNCSGERSFSLLKRMKSPLRSTMEQNKLCALSLLCIENDVAQELDYDDVISSFAALKLRKKPM